LIRPATCVLPQTILNLDRELARLLTELKKSRWEHLLPVSQPVSRLTESKPKRQAQE